MEVTLGSTEFKALSSDTRTQIIKFLNERNYTLSELSTKLNLASPTVKQHLEILGNSGLIEQIDSGHKWKYYKLTKKGKGLLNDNETTNILIVIGVSAVALSILLFTLAGSLSMASVVTEYQAVSAPMNSFGGDLAQVPAPSEIVGEELREGSTEIAKGAEETAVSAEQEVVREIEQLPFNEILSIVAGVIILSVIIGYLFGLLHTRVKKKRQESAI